MAPCKRDLPLVCLALLLPPSPRAVRTRNSPAVRANHQLALRQGHPNSDPGPFYRLVCPCCDRVRTFVPILNFGAELYHRANVPRGGRLLLGKQDFYDKTVFVPIWKIRIFFGCCTTAE
jgi:hypothetical protein